MPARAQRARRRGAFRRHNINININIKTRQDFKEQGRETREETRTAQKGGDSNGTRTRVAWRSVAWRAVDFATGLLEGRSRSGSQRYAVWKRGTALQHTQADHAVTKNLRHYRGAVPGTNTLPNDGLLRPA